MIILKIQINEINEEGELLDEVYDLIVHATSERIDLAVAYALKLAAERAHRSLKVDEHG